MQVIAHEPRFWFLVEGAEGLFLDVNCSWSAVGLDRLIKLNQDEEAQFRQRGRDYINELAEWVNDHALQLLVRHEQGEVSRRVSEIFTAWMNEHRVNGELPRL